MYFFTFPDGGSQLTRMEKAEVGLAEMLAGGEGRSTSDWVVMSTGRLERPGPSWLWATTLTV